MLEEVIRQQLEVQKGKVAMIKNDISFPKYSYNLDWKKTW